VSDLPPLDDIEIVGRDVADVDESCKLHGPPGTGKTTQSAARVAQLVRNHDVRLSNVAWATYRRALATDTLERFEDWGLLEQEDLDRAAKGNTKWISTFHALGNRLYDDLPDAADTRDYVDFCDKRDLRYWGRNSWEDGAGEMLFECFSWLRRNRLDPTSPADVRRWPHFEDLRDEWRGDVGQVWTDWQAYKRQEDLMDFYEMLERPLEDGRAPPCDVLVVDEYHDATPLMAALAERWIDLFDTVIVAGDPHQVVNNFDGADPRFFKRVNLPAVLLDRTYRVPEEHWRLAVTMLDNAHDPPAVARTKRGRIDEYRSPSFEHDNSRGWTVPAPDTPASPVAMVDRLDGALMFLTRTRMQAAGLCRALDAGGVIYRAQQSVNGGWVFDGDRLHLHNGLQQLAKIDPSAVTSGSGLSTFGNAGSGAAALDDLDLAGQEAARLLEYASADHLAGDRSEATETAEKWRRLLSDVSLREFERHVADTFWAAYCAGAGSLRNLNRGNLDEEDFDALERALRRYDDPVRREDRTVTVLTVHASKGRDAEHVVVYDGTAPRAAEAMRNSERSRRNEWRTWYVALTRASRHLHIMRDAFDWTVPILPDDLRVVVAGDATAATTETESDAP